MLHWIQHRPQNSFFSIGMLNGYFNMDVFFLRHAHFLSKWLTNDLFFGQHDKNLTIIWNVLILDIQLYLICMSIWFIYFHRVAMDIHTFLDFQHLQKAAFSAMSSISTKSATLASSKRTDLLKRVTLVDFRASGQNAKYDT